MEQDTSSAVAKAQAEEAATQGSLGTAAYDSLVSGTSDTVRDVVKEVVKAAVKERILEDADAGADYGSLVRTASVPEIPTDRLFSDVPTPSNLATPGGFRRNFLRSGETDGGGDTDDGEDARPSLMHVLLRQQSTWLYAWVEGIEYEEVDDLETPTRLVFRRALEGSTAGVGLDEHLVGDARTRVTLFKCYVATGVLFLPSGFHAAGLVAALATVVVVGVLSTYSVCLLLRTKAFVEEQGVPDQRAALLRRRSSSKNVATLSALGERAMGSTGKYLVEFSTFFSQFGFCCVYFSFAGRTVNDAFGLSIPLKHFVLGAAVFITPLTYIRHLSYFSIPNLIGSVFVVLSLFLITVNAALVILGESNRDVDWSCRHDTSSACMFINTETFLSFFGTSVYIFEGTTMVLPIQQSMKHPEHLPGMAATMLSAIAVMFCVFGGLNYFAFGQDTGIIILRCVFLSKLSPSFTFDRCRNQPTGLRLVLSSMFIVVAIFMFPLMIFPAANVLEKYFFEKQRRSGKKWSKNALRTLLVVSCATVAVLAGDSLDSLVAVIGGLFCVPLALVYPSLFFLLSGCAQNPYTEVLPAFLTLVFGLLSSVLSSASAIYHLVQK